MSDNPIKDFGITKVKNDIRDMVRYSELTLQDIRNDKIDNCIISDMDRIIGIANDIKKVISILIKK